MYHPSDLASMDPLVLMKNLDHVRMTSRRLSYILQQQVHLYTPEANQLRSRSIATSRPSARSRARWRGGTSAPDVNDPRRDGGRTVRRKVTEGRSVSNARRPVGARSQAPEGTRTRSDRDVEGSVRRRRAQDLAAGMDSGAAAVGSGSGAAGHIDRDHDRSPAGGAPVPRRRSGSPGLASAGMSKRLNPMPIPARSSAP